MPLLSIPLEDLKGELKPSPGVEQAQFWCARLEAGDILYFPKTPVPIPTNDLEFLLGQHQCASKLHKNIAYKPARDKLSGVDEAATGSEVLEHLHAAMRTYSSHVVDFLGDFLAPYQRRWQVDYASFRPIEEQGRDLPVRRRNDLLHTDAFPTRPTRGWRILRFFHNIHPTRTRDWVVGRPFPLAVSTFAPGKLKIPQPESLLARSARNFAQSTGLAAIVPRWKRTPYDDFMIRLHDAMKADAEFQRSSPKEFVQFAPGSSWMVYTESVPHAVLAGQYALEQTLLVDPAALVTPESAPIAVLENMAGARLA